MDRAGLPQSCTFQEMKHDLRGMPCNPQGMGHSLPFVSHSLQGKPPNLQGMRHEWRFPCLEILVRPD
jgi:hypothetical protein